jgi:hypothetical protein
MIYLWNVAKDITFGYLELKCCNKNCVRTFKISRNSEVSKNPNNVSCNMGCALAAYNDFENRNPIP